MEVNYLTNGPVSQKLISQHIEKMGGKTESGGHMIFLGQVRADEINGKKIKKTIFSEFTDVKSVDIIHSTGIVRAGEISLLVFVSAGHRHQALQACSKTVELIKENLPVWKKEIYDDNSHVWK